jgi:flagellar basal-body rod modification protein FlgD
VTISAISAAAAPNASSASTATPANQLAGTQSEFLKLFMAQLQNQDPLNPQSGTDMVAQLAQFSSVEAQTQTNTQLAALTAAQSSTASAGLSSLVGRTCDATVGDFQLDGATGAPPPVQVTSTSPMKGASLDITNSAGKVVRSIPIPAGSESASLQWDGKDASGNPLPAGSYNMSVNSGTSTAGITANWHAMVSSVDLAQSGSMLRMGDILVSPGAISTIGAVAATATATPPSTTNPITAALQASK